MSNLLLSFEENTNGSRTAPADGSGVTAWLTTAVIQNPQDGYYPTVGSPAASGTTSGGACTLSGLSGSDAYWVCIVDAGTQSHWFKVGVGSAGSGTTYPFTYVPSPVAETSAVASVLTMPFTIQKSVPNSAADVGTNIPYGNNLAGEVGFSGQLVQAAVFAAGAVVVPYADNQFVWPKYASASGTWTWEEWVDVTDEAGVNSLNLDSAAVSISPFPNDQVNPHPASSWLLNETGSDLVYHSGVGYETTAGGFYIVTYQLAVIGNPGTMS